MHFSYLSQTTRLLKATESALSSATKFVWNKFVDQTLAKASLFTNYNSPLLPKPKRHINLWSFGRQRQINELLEFCTYPRFSAFSTRLIYFELNLGLGFSKFFFSSPIESGVFLFT